ncbi:MAG: hypothetical protein AVDCRST_MAG56-4120, partial [uncultured Cytophagales bacterium]
GTPRRTSRTRASTSTGKQEFRLVGMARLFRADVPGTRCFRAGLYHNAPDLFGAFTGHLLGNQAVLPSPV